MTGATQSPQSPQEAHGPGQRVLDRATIVQKFGRGRAHNVVFTNGVFDLLHRGHVEYLCAARRLGDALVVGVNSDASVRRLKGPSRPVNSQDDRAFLVAALDCVSAVTIFDEDTPTELIQALLPDVLVKGADYTVEQVAGRDIVERAGGRVVLIPLVNGKSTTAMLQHIRETQT
jgi:D-beta-D-heptose 7-phosphate kinase/D-beta-D-heptose 1-phosphate adenosyltransferase